MTGIHLTVARQWGCLTKCCPAELPAETVSAWKQIPCSAVSRWSLTSGVELASSETSSGHGAEGTLLRATSVVTSSTCSSTGHSLLYLFVSAWQPLPAAGAFCSYCIAAVLQSEILLVFKDNWSDSLVGGGDPALHPSPTCHPQFDPCCLFVFSC